MYVALLVTFVIYIYFFSSCYCNLLLVCFVGCCLPFFNCFILIVETFVTEFELVLLFFAVPYVDYDSTFSASASFRWLLLVLSEGLDMLALICAHFASVIFL